MTRSDNDSEPAPLPDVFCWTKFGAEAGEDPRSIFQRKELERRRNNGVFLWGIGQSVRPSLIDLLQATKTPLILFSPMKSAPAKRDVTPAQLVLWYEGTGYDGLPYQMPDNSLVTSRHDQTGRSTHFALVCQRETPLVSYDSSIGSFSVAEVRNLRNGTPLGASQVTSVVRRIQAVESAGTNYQVATQAKLIYPYLVRLTHRAVIPDSLRLDRAVDADLEPILDGLVEWKKQLSGCQQLSLV